jgi:hypothetical protein
MSHVFPYILDSINTNKHSILSPLGRLAFSQDLCDLPWKITALNNCCNLTETWVLTVSDKPQGKENRTSVGAPEEH